MDYIWSPWRAPYISGHKELEGCIFCLMAAADRDEENLIAFRGEHNFVVLNRFPYTNGHLMVVPYRHTPDLSGITDEAAAELMALIRASERHIRWVYHPDGMNIGMNIGESAGAGIAGHIHMHVLPRWSGDANFMTTVAQSRVLSEELGTTWQRLRDAFAAQR
jgi:ATP adenylyltransferase